jgi:hypothetical protein
MPKSAFRNLVRQMEATLQDAGASSQAISASFVQSLGQVGDGKLVKQQAHVDLTNVSTRQWASVLALIDAAQQPYWISSLEVTVAGTDRETWNVSFELQWIASTKPDDEDLVGRN